MALLYPPSWYESRRLAEELRERWCGAGLLRVGPVAAEPLSFDAGREPAAGPCRRDERRQTLGD